MPPEPLPWDRRDFSKERKHDRSSEALGSSASRWRETPHHGSYRWGSADFRRTPGHGKQGGWHPCSEEYGHGFAPSRSNDKILDDESCRPSGSRGDGKYCRNNKENKGSFSQKDWRGISWEDAASPNGPGRPADVNDQRSVDEVLKYNSHPHSEYVNTCDQFHLKDQHDKNGGVSGLGTGQRLERENSLGSIDLKPFKWTRSGSLSSRGSGFSHSSSSKSIGVDSNEAKLEAYPRNVTPIQSPSGDAAACVTSAALTEDTSSRKKPRLGWGEGLAKYEKKKVEGPDDTTAKNGMVSCGSNTEPLQSQVSNVAEKSPRVAGFLECASPATPSSVACSSSPGLEDKSFTKAVTADTDACILSDSLCPRSQDHSEGLAFNLENLELTPIANSLGELLQSDCPSSVDSGFVRSIAMNKLLVWKANVSKALEMTESEIDLLENELKSLISDSGSACPYPATSSSLPVVCIKKPCELPCTAPNLVSRPAQLQLLSSGDMIMEETPGALEEEHAEVKDEDIDSPGTATSKLVEPLPLGKAVSSSDTVKHGDCSRNSDTSRSEDLVVKCSAYDVNDEKTAVVSTCRDGIQLANNSCASLFTDNIVVHCDREDTLYDLIVASNRDSANRASEEFSKLLPTNEYRTDMSRAASGPCWKNDPLIKEKFAMKKHFLRFKERVITLKFRAFQHLWKEDMRLLSIRRYRAKSQKRFELSSRTVHSSHQKHRSSIRSRFSSPAGNLSLVPTSEMIDFTTKLLSDSQAQIYRSILKMPALVMDKKETMFSRFISSNGLVEYPSVVEKERSMINPWTSIEKEIFMDKLATFGKDFRKIASFLDHKTTADCVEFYYKNHKSDCFQKTKKPPEFAKQGNSINTYLVTSGKRWNRETNAASLDMLGAASAIAAYVDDGMENQQKCTSRFFFGASGDYKTLRGEDGLLERSSSLDKFVNERETVAADVLAGICGSLSSEAMSSCITSSIDPGEGCQERKCQRVSSSMKRPLTPEVTQNVDDETCSDESCGEMDPADWTDEEKSIFIQAVSCYGRDFAMISRCVRTRSRDQCKVFFSKARKCLGLDMMRPGLGNEGMPISYDANGGGSDTDEACLVETGSVICSDKSGSKMDEDLHVADSKLNHDESNPAGITNLPSDTNQSEENNGIGELDRKDTDLKLEYLVSDDCEAEGKAELDFNGDSNIGNGVGSEYLAVQVHENADIRSDSVAGQNLAAGFGALEESVSVGGANEHGLPSVTVAEVETETVGATSAEYSGAEITGHEPLLSGSSFNERRVENNDANISDSSCLNCSIRESNSVPQSTGSASLAANTILSPGFGVHHGNEHRNAVELDPAQKPKAVSLQQDNCLKTTSSALQDSVAVQYERTLVHDMTSSLDFEISRNQCQKSASTDDNRQRLSRHSLLDLVDSSQILRGYPVSVSCRKGVNGDISCKKAASLQSISKLDQTLLSDRYLHQNCYLQKCNSSKHHDSVGELQFLPQEQSRDHPRPQPCSSSDVEKPYRNGDVKLFGQILTHPSSQQKPNSSTCENGDKCQPPKLSGKPLNLKFTGNQIVDGNSTPAKFDPNNYLGLENVPVRSYGFWDGNKIQTGFPSLPDSAILLAKYPAAFGNYPTSSSKIEQQPLHSVVKSNERKVNSISVFPTREISSSNGVADYQVYRSREVQPFTVDMKQRQEMLFASEMQRRSEFEAVSSIQQQARGLVGINAVGRRGILVGGPRTGVSDPVAAIKMHYAKTEQYSGQTGSIIREEESWRGKGDIGR